MLEAIIIIGLIIALFDGFVEEAMAAASATFFIIVSLIVFIILIVKVAKSSEESVNKAKVVKSVKKTGDLEKEQQKQIETEKKLLQDKINYYTEIEQGTKFKDSYQEFQKAIEGAQTTHDTSTNLSELKDARLILDFEKERFDKSPDLEQLLIFRELQEAKTKDEELSGLIDKLLTEIGIMNHLEPADNSIEEKIVKMKKVYYPMLHVSVKKFNDLDYSMDTKEYPKVLEETKSTVNLMYEAIKRIEEDNTDAQSIAISVNRKVMDSLLQKDGLSSKNQMK